MRGLAAAEFAPRLETHLFDQGMECMSHAQSATTADPLVSETDHVQLSRSSSNTHGGSTTGVPIPSTSYTWMTASSPCPQGLCAVVTPCAHGAGRSSTTSH